ncbi:MAG: hypothetical protein NVS3B21_10540 [Acidimicrobiales bacterium]
MVPGPAVGVDGTIYAASNAGLLHAIDPATGADRWTFNGRGSYGSDLSTTPVVLASGTVLWPGPHNTLFALSGSGTPLWSERFDGFVLSPADRTDGRVYIGDARGTLSAIDVGPGVEHRLAWSISVGTSSYGSPVIAPDGTIVTTVSRSVVAVRDDGASASVAWTWDSPADIEVSAGVGPDGTVVVAPNDEWVYGVSLGGRLRWRWRKGDWSYSSVVVTADGKAWFGDHLGFLDVVDSSTGQPVRRLPTIPKLEPHPGGVGVWTSPAVDGVGDVYFGTVVGHIYGFGPTGERLFDLDTGGQVDSYPALDASGTLYIGSSTGALYAVGR